MNPGSYWYGGGHSHGAGVGDDDGGGSDDGDGAYSGSIENNEVENSWKRPKRWPKIQAEFILSEVVMRSLFAHSDPCSVLVFSTKGLIHFHPAGSDSGIRDRWVVSE